jgi:hypothetical protein
MTTLDARNKCEHDSCGCSILESTMILTRRLILTTAAAVPFAHAAHAATKLGDFDLADPRDQLFVYAKMRARLDSAHALWHHAIDMFALIDGQVSEFLFRREGVGAHKARVEADGTLTVHYAASTYPMDGDGVRDGQWTNPITGKVVTLRALPAANGPVVKVTAAGSLTGAKNAARDLVAPSAERYVIGVPMVIGGRVSISDDMLVYRTAADQQRIFSRAASAGDYTATELGAYEAELAEVMNPSLPSAPAQRAMVGVVPFQPDLGFGDTTGALMIRHRAHKLAAPDELPARLRARVEADSPGFLTAPKLAI